MKIQLIEPHMQLEMKNEFSIIIQNAKRSGCLRINSFKVRFTFQKGPLVYLVEDPRGRPFWRVVTSTNHECRPLRWTNESSSQQWSTEKTRLHCATQTLVKINELGCEALPQPPYPSDLASLIFNNPVLNICTLDHKILIRNKKRFRTYLF